MKIKAVGKFVVELSMDELIVIHKLIGRTSFASRKDKFGMTSEQSSAADSMYSILDDLIHGNGDNE